jgi:hypothetical protein
VKGRRIDWVARVIENLKIEVFFFVFVCSCKSPEVQYLSVVLNLGFKKNKQGSGNLARSAFS